ncbi:MAG: HlyU family transcriptional regulator [Pseudomonadota bacterium]
MAGFLKRLFGGGGSTSKVDIADKAPEEIYKQVEIRAAPQPENGQWRIAGTLTKTTDGEAVVRNFMRADLLPSEADAIQASVNKARLIIDQNGASLWTGDKEQMV